MLLYHGTRVDRETLLREGLKRPNYQQLIDKTLAKYGYTREDVPERIWKWELEYRLKEYKEYSPEFQPYLAFTLNYEQAKDYAFMGGEFEYLLILHLWNWKTKDPKYATKKAVEGRGTPKVVTVDIPEEYIPRKILEQVRKIKELGYDPHKGFSWSIPIFRDIPPEWIVRIEEVDREHVGFA